MTNFVLTGHPNFVLIGETRQPSWAQPTGQPSYFQAEFAEVLALAGASDHGSVLTQNIVYSERAETAVQQVLDRFGFERRPDTFAELYGLLDYCDRLTAISGLGVVPPNELPAWQARSFLLMSASTPPYRRAAELFCVGDLDGLRAWHREPDVLRHLGNAYRRVA